jgi:Tfp pilus assembly protein PilO
MTTSLRRIAVLAAAVSAVLVIVWYIALWRPQAHSLSAAHKARVAAEQRIGQLHGQAQQMETLVQQVPADSAKLKELQAALPDNPSLDAALVEIHQAAVAAAVQLVAVGPSPVVTSTSASSSSASSSSGTPGGQTITLTISANGSYPQLMSFVKLLTGLPRVVVIDRLQLSGGSQLTADIGARIFYAANPTS